MAAAAATSLNLTQTQLNLSNNLTSSGITPLNNLKLNRHRKKLPSFPVRCSVNLPLKPITPAGKSLSTVLQNEPRFFYDAVAAELSRVVEDKDAALARFKLSIGSPEASLHRRIAELKGEECQVAVEDVLYMIISYKFSEIRVPLVPSLSKCLYNNRLEILPSKDWELESIHSGEVLEMVREHLRVVLGWEAGSSVTANWSTTEVRRQHISQVYAVSVLFGYFLKSASLRLCLEDNLNTTFQNVPCGNLTPPPESSVFGQMAAPRSATQVTSRPEKTDANLRCYVTGLDMQTREVCAKLKSEEAAELIEKHCGALFGNGETRTDDKNEMILTSLSSMKRLALEAVAFGCFLWDAEQFVSRIYKLKDTYDLPEA